MMYETSTDARIPIGMAALTRLPLKIYWSRYVAPDYTPTVRLHSNTVCLRCALKCPPAIGCGQVSVFEQHSIRCKTKLSTEKTALTLNAYCMHLTAIWLLPQDRVYGDWPRSGEIDLLESRGNRKYVDHNNEHIGVENFGSTLHFGPRWDQDGWSTATMNKRTPAGQGYDRQFHNYKLEWTPTYIRVFLDNNHVGEISVDDGFWKRGNFQGENIWPNDSPMAPFDKEVFSYWFFFFVVRCTLKMKWFVVCSFSSSWIWPLVERMDTSQTRATMAASHGLILNHLPILPTGMASNNGWIRGIWWAVTRHWSLIRSKFGLFNFESVLDVIELAICLPIQQ